MKILILNGNPDTGKDHFNEYLFSLKELLLEQNHVVEELKMAELEITPCVGCWKCWVKYPGECFNDDDSRKICNYLVNSDLTIFATPLIMGFISAVLKKALDKMIPVILPFLEIANKELHHRKRYSQYPKIAGIFGLDENHDQTDFEISSDLLHRNAINMKTEVSFCCTTENKLEDVLYQISHI